MKNILIPLLTIFLFTNFSCASSQEKYGNISVFNPQYTEIHEEFKPYIREFMYRSKGIIDETDMYGITMGFKDYPTNTSTVGTCWITPWFREISISQKWWDENYSQLKREELIFHELGHCILYRYHTKPMNSNDTLGWLERLAFKIGIFKEFNGRLEDGCPSSYMHPYTVSEQCIIKHYTHYMEELFKINEILVEEEKETIIFENKYEY